MKLADIRNKLVDVNIALNAFASVHYHNLDTEGKRILDFARQDIAACHLCLLKLDKDYQSATFGIAKSTKVEE